MSSMMAVFTVAGLSITETLGPGLPIVFVHGFAGSKDVWSAQMKHLGSRHHTIAFDLRGHGESTSPSDGDYSISALSHDVETIARHLRLNRFVLIAHSIGGYIAIEYAHKHPDKVAGILLVDSSGDYRRIPDKEKNGVIKQFRNPRQRERAFESMLAGAKASTRKHVLKQIRATPQATFENFSPELFRYDPTAGLHDYLGPVLAIFAPDNEDSMALQNIIPTLPRHRMGHVSHWVMLDAPNQFNRLLDEFLRVVEKNVAPPYRPIALRRFRQLRRKILPLAKDARSRRR